MTYPVPAAPADTVGALPPTNNQTVLPTSQWLTQNPQLPVSPAAAAMGQFTDSQYAADLADLRNTVAKQYADILQKLGYQDDQGNFIMGSVEDDANRQQALLQRQIALSDEGVTKQAQQDQTLFSGLRGINQARAEFPFVQNIADLQRQTPLTLQGLYEQAAGLMGDFSIKNQQLLAAAAQRQAAALQNIPPAAGGGGDGGGGGGAGAGAPAPTGPPAVGNISGILQDPGVPGQTVGDLSPPPTTYNGYTLDPNFQGGPPSAALTAAAAAYKPPPPLPAPPTTRWGVPTNIVRGW